MAQLGEAKAFDQPIVIQTAALEVFSPAEAYHQNYPALHPNEPCIMIDNALKISGAEKAVSRSLQRCEIATAVNGRIT